MTVTEIRALVPDSGHRLPLETAYARALSGEECSVVNDDGGATTLQARRWLEAADSADRELFVAPCSGPTLDVGCGPGRLLVALQRRGIEALGVDASAAAVARARESGVSALCADVFSLSGTQLGDATWAHVLLADGNVGIGGCPARLLGRVRDLLAPGGSVHVELDAGARAAVTTRRLRLQVGGRRSTPFHWSTVGTDAIGPLADQAGLRVLRVDRRGGRHVAVLQHR